MTFNEKVKDDAERKRTVHLLLSLAKVLEHPPSTLHDDGPNGAWIDTVGQLTRELLAAIGGTGPLAAMAEFMQLLNQRGQEAADALAAAGFVRPAGEPVWFALLDYARAMVANVQTRDQHIRELEIASRVIVEDREKRIKEHEDTIAELRAEIARTPKRFRTIGD